MQLPSLEGPIEYFLWLKNKAILIKNYFLRFSVVTSLESLKLGRSFGHNLFSNLDFFLPFFYYLVPSNLLAMIVLKQ